MTFHQVPANEMINDKNPKSSWSDSLSLHPFFSWMPPIFLFSLRPPPFSAARLRPVAAHGPTRPLLLPLVSVPLSLPSSLSSPPFPPLGGRAALHARPLPVSSLLIRPSIHCSIHRDMIRWLCMGPALPLPTVGRAHVHTHAHAAPQSRWWKLTSHFL